MLNYLVCASLEKGNSIEGKKSCIMIQYIGFRHLLFKTFSFFVGIQKYTNYHMEDDGFSTTIKMSILFFLPE